MAKLKLLDEKTNKEIEIHYETYGDSSNPPIILLHGWLCNSSFWDEFLVLKDLGYYLIIPDLRGHGNSASSKDVSIKSMGEDIDSLLNSLNISKAIIIGHSMGGLTAQAFYHNHPNKVIALGLLDTGGRIPFGYGIGTSFYVFRLLSFIISLLLSYPIRPLFNLILSQGWKFAFAKKGKSEAFRKFLPGVKALSKKAVIKAAFSLPGFKGLELLKEISVPTIIFQGKEDRFITPIQLAERMHKEIPVNKLYIVEGAAHFPVNEQTEITLNYLKEFLMGLK